MNESLRDKLRRLKEFVTEDVWDIDLSSLSGKRSFRIRSARVVHLVFKGFKEDECPLHASALTYSTLMSIVPILAISLALVRGLGEGEPLKNWIKGRVESWTQNFEYSEQAAQTVQEGGAAAVEKGYRIGYQIEGLIEDLLAKMENVSFTALGSAGVVLLIWMVIQVLGRVEASFNRVWAASSPRPLWRKITDYLSVLLVLPVLVTAASSLPIVDLISRVTGREIAETIGVLLESPLLKGLTIVTMTTLSFTFLLMFMPNVKVRLIPGLVGGVVTCLLFLLWLKLCATFQVAVGRYGNIYGSFAVVPILLAWVYVSWQIVLLGAEVGFAVQNVATYRMEQGARRSSAHARVLLALCLTTDIAKSMMGKNGVFRAPEYARSRKVPVRFLNDVLLQLENAGLLAEISDKEGEYVLLKAPVAISAKDVSDAVIRSGAGSTDLGLDDVSEKIGRLAAAATGGLNEELKGTNMQTLAEATG
jgi:membrane protein